MQTSRYFILSGCLGKRIRYERRGKGGRKDGLRRTISSVGHTAKSLFWYLFPPPPSVHFPLSPFLDCRIFVSWRMDVVPPSLKGRRVDFDLVSLSPALLQSQPCLESVAPADGSGRCVPNPRVATQRSVQQSRYRRYQQAWDFVVTSFLLLHRYRLPA